MRSYRLVKSLTLLLMGTCATYTAHAQTHPYTLYLESDGLINSQVYDMAQATDGTMWFATISGISRYDGASWESFEAETYGLPSDYEVKIKATDDGSIWAAGFFEKDFVIKRWRKGTWEDFVPQLSVKSVPGNHYAFAVWTDSTGESLKLAFGHSDKPVQYYDADASLWDTLHVPHKDRLPRSGRPKRLSVLSFGHDGGLWAGTDDGLLRLVTGQFEHVPSYDGSETTVYDICFGQQGVDPIVLYLDWIGEYKNDIVISRTSGGIDHSQHQVSFSNITVNSHGDIYYNLSSPIKKLENGKARWIHTNDYIDNPLGSGHHDRCRR